jgi:hypothetical protein
METKIMHDRPIFKSLAIFCNMNSRATGLRMAGNSTRHYASNIPVKVGKKVPKSVCAD